MNSYPPSLPGTKDVLYYGGWDMEKLRQTAGMTPALHRYENRGWSAKSGFYQITIIQPEIGQWQNELRFLQRRSKSWDLAPAPLIVSLFLVHRQMTGVSLLEGNFCRCHSYLPDHMHWSGLRWYKEKVEFLNLRDFKDIAPLQYAFARLL